MAGQAITLVAKHQEPPKRPARMNAIVEIHPIQQNCVQKRANQMDTCDFFNLLTSPEPFVIVEHNLPAHRERRYPPTETLSMFLSQATTYSPACERALLAVAQGGRWRPSALKQ